MVYPSRIAFWRAKYSIRCIWISAQGGLDLQNECIHNGVETSRCYLRVSLYGISSLLAIVDLLTGSCLKATNHIRLSEWRDKARSLLLPLWETLQKLQRCPHQKSSRRRSSSLELDQQVHLWLAFCHTHHTQSQVF